jgi:hypothetical protein
MPNYQDQFHLIKVKKMKIKKEIRKKFKKKINIIYIKEMYIFNKIRNYNF